MFQYFLLQKSTPLHGPQFKVINVNCDITVISMERHFHHNLHFIIKQKQLGNVGE